MAMRIIDERRRLKSISADGVAGACPFQGDPKQASAPGQTPLPGTSSQRKTMVLTGASRGIGHATVKLFSQAGWRIITCSRHPFNRDRCPGTWDQKTTCRLTLPTIAPAAGDRRYSRTLNGGPVHALVNNAGISPKGADNMRMTSLTTSIETWMNVFHVNFLAPILLARGLFDELKRGGGTVVNLTSIVGVRVHPFAGTAYATSKAALACLTREMAHDFAPHGIRVNAISPGEIRTDILSPDIEARLAPMIPMRRIGTPDEVANVVFFLCSDAASYVTGEEIQINGGQHL